MFGTLIRRSVHVAVLAMFTGTCLAAVATAAHADQVPVPAASSTVLSYAQRPTLTPNVVVAAPSDFGQRLSYDSSSAAGNTYTSWRLSGAGDYTIRKTTFDGTTTTVGTVPAGPGDRVKLAAAGPDRVYYVVVNDTRATGTPAPLNDTTITAGYLEDQQTYTSTLTTLPGTYSNQDLYGAANGDNATFVQHLTSGNTATATRVISHTVNGWVTDTDSPVFDNASTQVSLQVADDGATALAWDHTAGAAGSSTNYQVATRPAGTSTWGPATTLVTASSAGLTTVSVPQLLWNTGGTLDALWAQYARPDDPGNGIYQSRLTAGSWSPPAAQSVTSLDPGAAPRTDLNFSATDVSWTHPGTGETVTGRMLAIDTQKYFEPTGSVTFTQWAQLPEDWSANGAAYIADGGVLLNGPSAATANDLSVHVVSAMTPDVYAPVFTLDAHQDQDWNLVYANDVYDAQVTGCALRYAPPGGALSDAPADATTNGATYCEWQPDTDAADGSYELAVTATDATGNTASYVYAWTINRAPGDDDPTGGPTGPSDPGAPGAPGAPSPVNPGTPGAATVTGAGPSTVLGANAHLGTWRFHTTVPAAEAIWRYTLTTYAPGGAKTTRTTSTGSGTLRAAVADGHTLCVHAQVRDALNHTYGTTKDTCRTARLDIRASRLVSVTGNTTTIHNARAHGHTTTTLLGAHGPRKAALVRFTAGRGATVRFVASGPGRVTVSIPGRRPVTLTGTALGHRTWSLPRAGRITITHLNAPRRSAHQPVTMDSVTLLYP